MDDHSTMTAAPMSMALAGKTYQGGPLTLRDFGHIEQWARGELVKSARAAIADASAIDLSDDDKIMILDRAYKVGAKMRVDQDSEEILSMMMTIGGILQILWSSVRKYHKISVADLGDLLTLNMQSEFENAAQDILRASGLEVVTDDDGADKKSEAKPEDKTKTAVCDPDAEVSPQPG